MALTAKENHGSLWFDMNNCAITRIDFNAWGSNVVYQNRLEHLPARLVT
jgi:hypothetical protein